LYNRYLRYSIRSINKKSNLKCVVYLQLKSYYKRRRNTEIIFSIEIKKSLCNSIGRHDAVILFEKLQPAVLHALDKITLWTDSVTASSASQLLSVIRQLKFQTPLSIF